jgi:hypothetical protein
LKSMVNHKHDRHTCFCYYKNPQIQTFIWSHNSEYFSCAVQITEEIFSVCRSHKTKKIIVTSVKVKDFLCCFVDSCKSEK